MSLLVTILVIWVLVLVAYVCVLRKDLQELTAVCTADRAARNKVESDIAAQLTNVKRNIEWLEESRQSLRKTVELIEEGIEIPGVYNEAVSYAADRYRSRNGKVIRMILDHLKLDPVQVPSKTTPAEFKLVAKGKK